MRLDTGAMRSAKRSPSDNSATVVATAAGRSDVSRGNSLVGMGIPSPFVVSGRGIGHLGQAPLAGPPRRAVGRRKAPTCRPYARRERWRKAGSAVLTTPVGYAVS